MNLLRNILTAIWCAIVIGTSVFALVLLMRVHGLDVTRETALMLPATQFSLLALFGFLSLVSTKFLWAVFAVAAMAALLGLAHELLVARNGEGAGLADSLFLIIPTYLLARWNAAAPQTEFNPVKEF